MKNKFGKTEQEKQALIQEYRNKNQTDKRSLCRFYLRGICLFKKNQCKFSHGIKDLIYQKEKAPFKPKQYYADVHSQFNQKSLFRSQVHKLSYHNLFESQTKYTLQQINQFRDIRYLVRKKFHANQFNDFIKLLQLNYPGEDLTEDFIQRQYYRVGFNKLMTRIKFSFLTDFLCNESQSEYMRVNIKKKNYIVKKCPPESIDVYYIDLLIKYIQTHEQIDRIKQNQLKSWLFLNHTKLGIPLVSIHIKNLNKDLKQYIQQLCKRSQTLNQLLSNKIIESNADRLLLTKKITQIVESSQQLINFDTLLQKLIPQIKSNTYRPINLIKQLILQKGYKIYHIPNMAFILNEKMKVNTSLCKCNLKIVQQIQFDDQNYELQKVIVVNDEESFRKSLPSLMKSKILAVDLEGRLRKNAFIQIIQLNNTKHIYLIDLYHIINNLKNQALFRQIKVVMRNLMLNKDILKVFHDSRHDSLALHQFIQTCIINVFDTSAVDIYRVQIQKYSEIKQITNIVINDLTNVRTPGLNQLLKKYNAPNGVNPYKQEFHKLMKQNSTNIFHQRPLNKQYQIYCVKDVQDLPYLSEAMSQGINKEIIQFLGHRFIQQGYNMTL